MIALSTAWNAERHAGWVPAVREILAVGHTRIALDGPALQADAGPAGREARAARGLVVALFAPAPSRDAAGQDPPSLVDPRPERREAAVAAAAAAARCALDAGTTVVVLRAGALPTLDAGREDRWTQRLARGDAPEALRAEVAAARDALVPDRARALEQLCRSLWELGRTHPDVAWALETPASVAGVPWPSEVEQIASETRGRRTGYWHDAALAARLGALGAVDPASWLDRAGALTRGVTIGDWSPHTGRTPPGAGAVDWTALRAQLSASMVRVVRLPPEVPAAMVKDALRDAAERTA